MRIASHPPGVQYAPALPGGPAGGVLRGLRQGLSFATPPAPPGVPDRQGSVVPHSSPAPLLLAPCAAGKLNDREQALHDQVIELRNKAIAHSDAELMRMVVKPHQIDIGDGQTMPYINPAFDEGLDFLGIGVMRLLDLFHKVYHGLYVTLLDDARERPDRFDIHHDYLFPRE